MVRRYVCRIGLGVDEHGDLEWIYNSFDGQEIKIRVDVFLYRTLLVVITSDHFYMSRPCEPSKKDRRYALPAELPSAKALHKSNALGEVSNPAFSCMCPCLGSLSGYDWLTTLEYPQSVWDLQM
jgi:hypothetical protein